MTFPNFAQSLHTSSCTLSIIAFARLSVVFPHRSQLILITQNCYNYFSAVSWPVQLSELNCLPSPQIQLTIFNWYCLAWPQDCRFYMRVCIPVNPVMAPDSAWNYLIQGFQ